MSLPLVFSGVRVAQCLVFCVVFCRSLIVFFLLAIVLSVLRFRLLFTPFSYLQTFPTRLIPIKRYQCMNFLLIIVTIKRYKYYVGTSIKSIKNCPAIHNHLCALSEFSNQKDVIVGRMLIVK